MSWRCNGEIVTVEEAKRLSAAGKVITAPWRDIGYHWGLESVKGKIVVQKGRPMDEVGAHCIGMNSQAIGICCVGNFDMHIPSEATYFNCAQLCATVMKMFPAITIGTIEPHNKYSNKTCPGNLFDMNRLLRQVRLSTGR
jgi:N-acetylmuramoyl-L-alanine amidase